MLLVSPAWTPAHAVKPAVSDWGIAARHHFRIPVVRHVDWRTTPAELPRASQWRVVERRSGCPSYASSVSIESSGFRFAGVWCFDLDCHGFVSLSLLGFVCPRETRSLLLVAGPVLVNDLINGSMLCPSRIVSQKPEGSRDKGSLAETELVYESMVSASRPPLRACRTSLRAWTEKRYEAGRGISFCLLGTYSVHPTRYDHPGSGDVAR